MVKYQLCDFSSISSSPFPPAVLSLSFIPFNGRQYLKFLFIWIPNQPVILRLKDIRNTGHPISTVRRERVFTFSFNLSFLHSWNLTLELMFQGPHERRGMQREREKKRANSCITMIGSNTCSSYAKACTCAHTLNRCELYHDTLLLTISATRSAVVCIIAADTELVVSDSMSMSIQKYMKCTWIDTGKLFIGSLLRNVLFHVASDFNSLGLILHTKK